ncbi:MAG TPA: aminotransferase class V-fold PLP-dependent enzyme [Acidimicrobiia bacterium]|nr:aminotransferase class V-fold PLP-dependent enzyme [Acidimicrobiia bacterium]
METDRLIKTIRRSVIGADTAVFTPYGLRRVTYADYTASARSLAFIEDFIRETVLPLYANTHTETSGTGLQTTRFREDARTLIRHAVGGDENHAVIFAGSGSTGAIDRLITILGVRVPAALDDEFDLSGHIPVDRRPVVFVGPYEHHSNELGWRETIADVVEIAEDSDGHIDLDDLERRLIEFSDRPLRIGSFSAASNVTGIITDTSAISTLLHEHGALSFWDFAAAAPYVGISMRQKEGGNLDYKDAIFISPHKFIGGPGTPGVLVVRKDLLANRVPSVPGGGTVAYVNELVHRYLTDPEHREEGGTPAIVESIRAGLVFQLKEAVGVPEIRRREEDFIQRAIDSWSQNPNLQILGNPKAERLSIVSFVIRFRDRYLHHNYVVALLNDLFGIQARGGCSCAGPYGHRLLGIDLDTSRQIERQIGLGCEVVKPGWVRVNFNYFISEEEFAFIVEGVHLIAQFGWRLLPQYRFEAHTALWRHRRGLPYPPLSLFEIDYRHGLLEHRASGRASASADEYPRYLTDARTLFATAAVDSDVIDDILDVEAESLRWFPLPHEVGV